MATDPLLDTLVSGLMPVRRRSARRDGLVLGLLAAIELALFLMMGAARHDILRAMSMPSFWWKLASLGTIALVGAVTAVRAFDPVGSPRRGLGWLLGAAGAALTAGWMLDAAHPHGAVSLWARLMWRHGVACSIAMAVLALPMLIALGLLMRRAAPTHRNGTALAIGIAGTAWGAFVFMFNCAHDDPLYIAVWSLAACAILTLASRLLLPLLTRW